jgi:uncharacterized protein (TIGR03435 family)
MKTLHAAIALLLLMGQPAPPAFEVVTIKASDPLARGGRSGWQPGGRYQGVNIPGVMLVQTAFGTNRRMLLGYQVVGAPAWLAAARYDVTGKVRSDLASVDPAELAVRGPRFLQSLLEDRFKLQVHHETRQLQRYRLVLARRDGTLGPQLKVSKCTRDDLCKLEYGPGRLVFEGVSIGRLADDLCGYVSQVIADETGLTGRFDLNLEWSPDQVATDKPSMFTALQEQLGLKLEPEHGPVDVVVIDHIERPTED